MKWALSRWMAAAIAILIIPSVGFAWEDPSILQVEEDWELVVLTPDHRLNLRPTHPPRLLRAVPPAH